MRRPFVTLLALVASVVPLVDGTLPAVAAVESSQSGYWMLGSDGKVYPFGGAADHGDQVTVLRANPSFHGSPVKRHSSVDLEPSPSGAGYWILTNTGMIDAFGDARGRVFIGRLPALDGGEEATSLSATPSGNGLWIFTSRGRVVPYGDARHFGDMAGTTLNGPVLDAVPTTSGLGYFMVGSDGGIFAFGDAAFAGSMGGHKLNAPVQSLVPDGDDAGYWLVASDGGIFAFNAPFKGSMGGTKLNKPVTGMVRAGSGYLMVGEDGGIFNFSGQPFAGSLGDRPPAQPIVAVAAFEDSQHEPAGGTSGHADDAPNSSITVSPPTTSSSTTTSTTAPTEPEPVEEDPLPTGMPTDAPDMTLPCETTPFTAKIWNGPDPDTTWAVHNPCDRAVLIGWNYFDAGASTDSGVVIGPGVSFHEPGGTGGDYWNAYLTNELEHCWPEGGLPMRLQGSNEWVEPSCDDDEDEEEEPDYHGPLCFGLVPDYIGTDGDDQLPSLSEDRNGDGEVTIHGLGGNDTWSNGSFDSGTFTDTQLCGGDGDDVADGWLWPSTGGRATTRCGPPPAGRRRRSTTSRSSTPRASARRVCRERSPRRP